MIRGTRQYLILQALFKQCTFPQLAYTCVLLSIFVLMQACNESAKVSKNSETDSVHLKDVYEFETVDKYGYLLGNGCDFYGDILNATGHFQPEEGLVMVHIVGISKNMFNLKGQDDKCLKAHFVKIELDSKSYIVFGRDVFVIEREKEKRIQNVRKEEWAVYPIKPLQMGASDEGGLTECDEYSYIVMKYNKTGRTTLLQYPKNDSLRMQSGLKYAALYNDDMSDDVISSLDFNNDTLYMNIQSQGQEGGHTYTIKAHAYSKLPYTEIINLIRFETDETCE